MSMEEVDDSGYKNLEALQMDTSLNDEMKSWILGEYIRRVKKLCRSKLGGGNYV